jgi:hypothetical protein
MTASLLLFDGNGLSQLDDGSEMARSISAMCLDREIEAGLHAG